MFWSGDDPDSFRRVGVAGDRPRRYAQGLSVLGRAVRCAPPIKGRIGGQSPYPKRPSMLEPYEAQILAWLEPSRHSRQPSCCRGS